MDARSPLSQKPYNRPRNTPARAIWAFCLGMVIITILSGKLRQREHLIEVVEFPTGLGEKKKLYEIVQPIKWHQAVATLADETPLFLRADQPVHMRDSVMLKVHLYRDRYHVYRPASATESGPQYYLKVGKSEYVPLGLKPMARPSQHPE